MGLGPLNTRLGRRSRRVLYALLLGLTVLVSSLLPARPVEAAAGVNGQINFQGRLLNSQGAAVADGYYNVQFKIYQDGDGQSANNATGSPAGSLEWTETYLNANSQGVLVRNGFMSVQLGSVTAFGSSVDWNQDTLWLSMNVAGLNNSCTPFANCTPDGEMLPMKRMSSSAYALNAGQLGGLTAAGFIQNTTTVQTANIAVQSGSASAISALVQGAASQTADIFQVKANGTAAPLLAVGSSGSVTLQNSVDSASAFRVLNSGNGLVLGVNTSTNLVRVVTGSVTDISLTSGTGALQVGGDAVDNLAIDDNEIMARNNGAASTLYVQKLGGGLRIQANETLVKPAASSETTFQIQPASSSTPTFIVDTSNNQIGIGIANPAYTLDVVGDINTSTGFRVGGTAGASTTCAGGQVLSATVIQGGIVTGGSCVTASDGVTTVGTFSGTSVANGASITGNTITFAAADAVNPGMISTTTQTFAGDKTFNDDLAVSGTYNGNTFTGSQLSFSSASTSSVQSAASQSLLLDGQNGLSIQTGSVTRATFDSSNGLYLGNGITAAAPNNFTISSTGSNVTGVAGGALTIQGGDATVGNANGGNLYLRGGNGAGTGIDGLVVISTPTFSTTTNDTNCYTGGALVAASCTITTDSVNSSAVIVVGFTVNGQIATLPDPTLAMAGRVVYITAANGSSDFTLSTNGGGVGNVVAMRQNTSATMIWNGSDWTAAGASSSTTLQSAYDSTLQTAGGAELIVSKTSSTNGLTIRDSSTSPVDGTLFSVQTNSAANLLTVNSNITEYASNAGAEAAGASTSTFPASTWGAIGSTVSRYTTAGNFIAGGQASVSVVTSATANTGVKNTLSTSLTANTLYNVSFAARLSSGTFTDMNVYYSIDGTAASVSCTTGQAVNSSVQTKINCAFKAPASGITAGNAILIRQTSGVARTFYVDNLSVTIAADYNYATDGSVDDGTNFATNWSAVGSSVTRSTSFGNDASNSAQVVTTAGSGQGVRNKLSVNPLQSTTYRVTAYASSSTSGFDSFTVRYSHDGGTNFTSCTDYNTQEVGTPPTNFTKITCYITTDSTAATNAYVYFTQNDAVARTFYVDTFSMTLSTKITPNVQIGGGVNGGPVTLLTMDRAAAAPIASNNEALLGSMYYDTSLGKLQCYEADGWGACGSSPDDVVTISPEYTNAVLHGTGVGTMTSDICSDTLNINDGSSGQATICGSNETYNFYKWTSPQASAQTYSIFVTYQLPTTFKSFLSGQASLMGRTDSTNSTVSYQIYRQDTSSGLVACGSSVSVSTGAAASWQTGIASGAADPSTCGFTPGSSIVFKIDVTASQNANAYVGNLNFAFNNN